MFCQLLTTQQPLLTCNKFGRLPEIEGATMRTALAILLLTLTAYAQQTADDPHHAGVNARGDQAMGFSHDTTTHHFRLYKDGGAIEVTANDPQDSGTRETIRMHLSHISQMFAAGNFEAPMFIHATNPPGVPLMKKLKSQIHYRYEDTENGARVRIQTENPKAIGAVHDFLRFQIKDHQTGDSSAVPPQSGAMSR
jgi:hypothetical protein